MTRFIRVTLACVLLFALSVPAFATEVKVSGVMDLSFGKGFWQGDNVPHGDIIARQRFRTFVDFIVSENLKAALAFEIGEANWGNVGSNTAKGQGFSMGGDGVNIEVKHAYIDWTIPNTKLRTRMGLHWMGLPYAVGGNPVLEHDIAGITLSYPISDNVSLTGFWGKMVDGDSGGMFDNSSVFDDDINAFGLILPIKLDGVQITPYALYVNVGKGAAGSVASTYFTNLPGGKTLQDDLDDFWLGVSVKINAWDPVMVNFDAIYGMQDTKGFDTHGFWAAASVDYKMASFTPGIFAWYSTGMDKDGEGAMPNISGTGFGVTSIGTDRAFAINSDSVLTNTGIGMWGVGIRLDKLPSFSDRLSHTIRLAYFRGTHDDDAPVNAKGQMTTDDWAWEVNFDTSIKLYDNLTAMLEIGYLGLDFDKRNTTWHDRDGAWKINLGMRFRF